jgi:hypothetical protein
MAPRKAPASDAAERLLSFKHSPDLVPMLGRIIGYRDAGALACHNAAMTEPGSRYWRAAETGRQPWARLYAEGHGDYWEAVADYADRHIDAWSRVLR